MISCDSCVSLQHIAQFFSYLVLSPPATPHHPLCLLMTQILPRSDKIHQTNLCLWDTVHKSTLVNLFLTMNIMVLYFCLYTTQKNCFFSISLVHVINCNFSHVSVSISTVILASCSFVYFYTVYQSLTNAIYCSEIPRWQNPMDLGTTHCSAPSQLRQRKMGKSLDQFAKHYS